MTEIIGERIIINGGHTGTGGILQLVANTNFPINDEHDYSTVSHNHQLSLGESMSAGLKTYTIDLQTFIAHADVYKFRYIKVEYTGQPNIRELREMFVNWLIYTTQTGLITHQDISIFRKQADYMKIYTNADGNGGIIIYNLYSHVVFPNGLMRYMFVHSGVSPMSFNFKDVPGVMINSVTLTTTYKFIPATVRSFESDHVRTHGRVTPKWQYFSMSSVTVPQPEGGNETNHILDATGNVHGMFIKAEYADGTTNRMVSLKIKLNHQLYVNYTNIIDFQLNTIKFEDCEWIFVPFDLERQYNTVADCFVADHNGGLELGRIDTVRIEINHQSAVKSISYAFPAYMSMHRGIIKPELTVRNPDHTSIVDGFRPRQLVDVLSNISVDTLSSARTDEDCVISHEPIGDGDVYAVCMTCIKPMSLEFAISWLKTPNAYNKCPHCRSKWREIGKDICVYKKGN
jgi:hypothetical protein